jgi:hypothetical protein
MNGHVKTLGGGPPVTRKKWRKPEVKSIAAGSAEVGSLTKNDGGGGGNNHS